MSAKYKVGDIVNHTHEFVNVGGTLLILKICDRPFWRFDYTYMVKHSKDGVIKEWSEMFMTDIVSSRSRKSPLPSWW